MIVDSSSIIGIFNISIITLAASLFTNAYTFVSALNEKLNSCVSHYSNIGLLYKPPKEIDKLKKYNLLSLVTHSRIYCIILTFSFIIITVISLLFSPMLEGYVINIQFTEGVNIVVEQKENSKSSAGAKCDTTLSKDIEVSQDQTVNTLPQNNDGFIKFLIWVRFLIAVLMLVNCTLLVFNILKVQHLQTLLLKAERQIKKAN